MHRASSSIKTRRDARVVADRGSPAFGDFAYGSRSLESSSSLDLFNCGTLLAKRNARFFPEPWPVDYCYYVSSVSFQNSTQMESFAARANYSPLLYPFTIFLFFSFFPLRRGDSLLYAPRLSLWLLCTCAIDVARTGLPFGSVYSKEITSRHPVP